MGYLTRHIRTPQQGHTDDSSVGRMWTEITCESLDRERPTPIPPKQFSSNWDHWSRGTWGVLIQFRTHQKGHVDDTLVWHVWKISFGMYTGNFYFHVICEENRPFCRKLPINPQSLDRVKFSSHKFNKTSSASSPSTPCSLCPFRDNISYQIKLIFADVWVDFVLKSAWLKRHWWLFASRFQR